MNNPNGCGENVKFRSSSRSAHRSKKLSTMGSRVVPPGTAMSCHLFSCRAFFCHLSCIPRNTVLAIYFLSYVTCPVPFATCYVPRCESKHQRQMIGMCALFEKTLCIHSRNRRVLRVEKENKYKHIDRRTGSWHRVKGFGIEIRERGTSVPRKASKFSSQGHQGQMVTTSKNCEKNSKTKESESEEASHKVSSQSLNVSCEKVDQISAAWRDPSDCESPRSLRIASHETSSHNWSTILVFLRMVRPFSRGRKKKEEADLSSCGDVLHVRPRIVCRDKVDEIIWAARTLLQES